MFANKFNSLRRWELTQSQLPEGYLKRSIDELLSGRLSQTLVRHNYSLATSSQGAVLSFYERNSSEKLLQLAGWRPLFFKEHPMDFSKEHFCRVFNLNQKRREEEETRFKQIVLSVLSTKSIKPIDEGMDSTCSFFSGSFLPLDSSRMNYKDLLQALCFESNLRNSKPDSKPNSKQAQKTPETWRNSAERSPVTLNKIEKLTATDSSQRSNKKNEAELSPSFWAVSLDPKKRQKYLKQMLIDCPFFPSPKSKPKLLARSSCLLTGDSNTKHFYSTPFQSVNIRPRDKNIGKSCHGSSKNVQSYHKKSKVLKTQARSPIFTFKEKEILSSEQPLYNLEYLMPSGFKSFLGSSQ